MTKPLVDCTYTLGIGQPKQSVLPGPRSAQVWIDFDGTLSRRDVLDDLIRTFSINESWKMIEEQWQAGLIGSRQCLEQQLALVDVSEDDLDAFLADVDLDPGALGLLKYLSKHEVPV